MFKYKITFGYGNGSSIDWNTSSELDEQTYHKDLDEKLGAAFGKGHGMLAHTFPGVSTDIGVRKIVMLDKVRSITITRVA